MKDEDRIPDLKILAPRGLSRRQVLKLGGASALSLWIAACGGSTGSGSSGGGGSQDAGGGGREGPRRPPPGPAPGPHTGGHPPPPHPTNHTEKKRAEDTNRRA